MSELSFKRNLILFSLVLFPLIVMLYLAGAEGAGFTRFLPDVLFFQIGAVFWLSAIAAIIGSVLVGFILTPVFLAGYKYTVGIRMTYGIQERANPTKLKIAFKALFPSLMAIQFGLMFSQNAGIQALVLTDSWLAESDATMLNMLTFVSILPFMMGIATGIFSPVWFLLDAGIVFTNKEKVKKIRDPIEVRSVGGWYHYILKGYTGITIIITYVLFVDDLISGKGLDNGLILIPLIPIFMVIMCIPAFIVLEVMVESRRKYTLKIANKMGISQPLKDPIENR